MNNDTGDIACDSYNKYREDVQLLKDMGVCNLYQFRLIFLCYGDRSRVSSPKV